jgi:transposase InsO family protein
MAESADDMSVRMLVATWPEGLPRGAVRDFCVEHGVSSSWFYKVRKIARDEGPVAAAQKSKPIPKSNKYATPPAVVEMARQVRKELADTGWDCGPISVGDRMRQLGMPTPSRATLARIFTDLGMVTPQPQKRPRSATKRFVYPRPNDCWQLDGTECKLADRVTKAVVLQVLDDCSRKILGSVAAPSENALDCWRAVEIAIGRVGPPLRFLTDNGTALNPTRRGYLGFLTRRLQALGVHTIASSKGRPQTCGKAERLHLTWEKWLRAQPEPETIAELQVLADRFEELYNNRPHQELPNRCTPNQAWDTTPLAPPPTPPGPQPEHPKPRPPLPTTPTGSEPLQPQVRHVRVGVNGLIKVAGLTVNMGRLSPTRGQQLIALISEDTLELFEADRAVLVRTIARTAKQRYYGPDNPAPTSKAAKVSVSGQLAAFETVIHIGSEHIGRTLLATLDSDQIRIHDPDTGQLLREITREPGRRYYGSGRPRGKRLPRVMSTKT